jgi:peptide/nickel transport system permease protein
LIRRSVDVVVSLLAVFLAAALCSFITIYQPVLRVVYDALASFSSFVMHAGRYWNTTGASVLNDYRHSLLALAAALGLAMLIGIPAGIVVGVWPASRLSTLIRVMSSLGTMTPSFLLALLLMIFFVLYVLPLTGIRFILLTSRTSDLDPRRLLPIALTLAARPLAYITLVTASAMQEVLRQDYIRTAYSKGLSRQVVLARHAWPNAVSAILATLPAMLLFSISSLPIVEFVFNWPGVGQELLFRVVASPAPNVANAALVSFLLASLGMTYVLIFLLVEAARERLEPYRRPAGSR